MTLPLIFVSSLILVPILFLRSLFITSLMTLPKALDHTMMNHMKIQLWFFWGHCRFRRRCTRRLNLTYRIESIKMSCWYQNFTQPGPTCKLTFMLANLDCFGEFRHWFHMPLEKIEVLTNLSINRGYIDPPRSHRCDAEFCKRLELLVMSALYLLGMFTGFCSFRALCHISTSEV
jgi:hypothetical protein